MKYFVPASLLEKKVCRRVPFAGLSVTPNNQIVSLL